jgi:hypothetical protein
MTPPSLANLRFHPGRPLKNAGLNGNGRWEMEKSG